MLVVVVTEQQEASVSKQQALLNMNTPATVWETNFNSRGGFPLKKWALC